MISPMVSASLALIDIYESAPVGLHHIGFRIAQRQAVEYSFVKTETAGIQSIRLITPREFEDKLSEAVEEVGLLTLYVNSIFYPTVNEIRAMDITPNGYAWMDADSLKEHMASHYQMDGSDQKMFGKWENASISEP